MEDVPSHARAPSRSKVKNKAPAKVQITAEQLLREAWERQERGPRAAPRQHLADAEELRDYQRVKRKEFEDRIIRSRAHIPLWIRYAKWEETQNEYVRARSIFERAIDFDHRSHVLWLHYAEMEMRNKFINHARNVWDRAVALLPRVAQLWLRYAYMEEMIGRVDLARLVFRRWVEWHPEPSAYSAFVKFELRNDAVDNARAVYELFIQAHPATSTYLKYARFEERQGLVPRARLVYERASDELPKELLYSVYFKSFAAFEERHSEFDRARSIYKYAVQNLPGEYSKEVGDAYAAFEKQRGGGAQLEHVLLEKRRAEYEQAITANALDYDSWFELVQLEETTGDHARIRATYERALAQKPPQQTKRAWQRYIFLWIRYAIWEELGARDLERTAKVYQMCLAAIPHKLFSFGKVWLQAAEVEIRRRNVGAARKILGNALGVLPRKHSLYRNYIKMELLLTELDRARKLYRVWIERNPMVSDPYIEFAWMEVELGEVERAREIFEIALSMPEMDVPESIWKAYIDMEIRCDEQNKAKKLYERLLKVSSHLNVWLSYVKLFADNGLAARDVFQRAHRRLRESILDAGKNATGRTDVAELLDAWVQWEKQNGDEDGLAHVTKLLPNKITKKKPVVDSNGNESGWEEYTELVFPEERVNRPQLSILQKAREWKARAAAANGGS